MQVKYVIPPLSVLGNLRQLKVNTRVMRAIPSFWFRGWDNVTLLDLSNNDFDSIPGAVTRLTALQTLDLTLNARLVLSPRDMVTVGALPLLRNLYLDMSDSMSLRELVALARRFPDLQFHKW